MSYTNNELALIDLISNINKTFPDNHKFHNLLDMQFKSDDELIEYDRFHKCYKINQILKSSLE